ncbi:MAG TPA: hypothetical protein VFW40_13975, partial [Capsulimonadaceae bacterium]|nr:hypothetical protein [Capsulimonadaceae bacterium]
MSFSPADYHTLIIACAPAALALVIAIIVTAIDQKRASGRAAAESLRQARLELDLLRRSTEAGIEQAEENIQRVQRDLNGLRTEAVERLRGVQARLETKPQEAPRAQTGGAAAFDFRPGAFETLWSKVLRIREFVGPILAVYNLPS